MKLSVGSCGTHGQIGLILVQTRHGQPRKTTQRIRKTTNTIAWKCLTLTRPIPGFHLPQLTCAKNYKVGSNVQHRYGSKDMTCDICEKVL